MSGSITSIFSPYRDAVTQALGFNPAAQAGSGQASSILDYLLSQEIAQGQPAPTSPTAAPQAPQEGAAPAAPQAPGASPISQAAQLSSYANRARQLYNLGERAVNAYNAGGAMDALGAAASYAIPAAATAIFAKGAQTLAKPGGEVGAGVGSAAGAALGTAIMPGFGTALGALLGGIAGGQIGPNPTVGPNFGALGTFDEQGNLRLSHQGGDNGGNASQALALGSGLAEALPVLAAQRGLIFNPRAAGDQITIGGYGQRGMFYTPANNDPSPEAHAAFARDPEAYLNIVLGDLAARGIYVPQGTTDFDAAYANRHANTPMNVYQPYVEGRGQAARRALGDLLNIATDTSFEGVYNRQRAAIEEWRRLQPILEQQRREALAAYERGNSPEGYGEGATWRGEGYASGGVVELEGGGKVAIGPGGGLDDLIPTNINGRRAAALSDGEFVIPADVVSMMGDGSSNAGARRLYDLVKQIRQNKTGTTQQAGPLPVGEILKRTLS